MKGDCTKFRAVTFRLHPGSQHKHFKLSQTAGACRYVWNHFLAINRYQYELYRLGFLLNKPSVSYQSLFGQFADLRKNTLWLRNLPCAPVRYTLKYQADAWRRAFKHGGFPRFHGRRGDDSFTIPQDVRIVGNRLRIPKIGWVKLSRKGGNPYEGNKPLRAVVKRVLGKWHCVVVYAVPDTRTDNGLAVGVDMNCGQVAVSTGDILHMPDMKRLEARRKRYQRMMSRRQKGSNRRKLARYRMARTSKRIVRVRHNWHHGVSRALADTAGLVAIEDLKPKAMTAKGKHKRGLNRSIRNTGWDQLRRMLEYKSTRVVAVNPAYTSQACNKCGAVDPENRKTQSKFHCVHCGHEGNADINAALNILASGTGATGRRGALALVTPRNRQNVCIKIAA